MKITYKRKGDYLVPYDSNDKEIPNNVVSHLYVPKNYRGYKHDGGNRGTDKEMDAFILHFLNTGERLTANELAAIEERDNKGNIKKSHENIVKGFEDVFLKNVLSKTTEKDYADNIKGIGIGDTSKLTETQLKDLHNNGSISINDSGKVEITPDPERSSTTDSQEPINPYVSYMERMQKDWEANELGLLQEQNLAQKQQAEIASQQMMMQNAQFKDQLIEQIKTDRLSKLKNGMSQMQIANEELQFMVGNQMQNQQAVSQVNQQLLGATQQEGMLPYQAYINAQQGVTGQQGYANFASGMAATDASSMDMQTKLMMRNQPWLSYQQAWEKVSTQKSENKQLQ